MNTCDKDHDAIVVYTGKSCPVCAAIKALTEEKEDLAERANLRILELQEQVDSRLEVTQPTF